jgi:hypothetical protein
MFVKADAEILGQDVYAIVTAIDAVTDRYIDQAIFPGDGYRGFAAKFRERIQTLTASAPQD